jgi:hypothetical protein
LHALIADKFKSSPDEQGIAPQDLAPESNQYSKTQVTPFSIKGKYMNITLSLAPVASLIAGILILAVPRLLNYIVAIYLITIGVLGLLGANGMHL